MLRIAGELTDGTVVTWTGVRTLESEHIVPTHHGRRRSAPAVPRRASCSSVRIAVTADPDGTRTWVAERFGAADDLPSYRAMLDREGVRLVDRPAGRRRRGHRRARAAAPGRRGCHRVHRRPGRRRRPGAIARWSCWARSLLPLPPPPGLSPQARSTGGATTTAGLTVPPGGGSYTASSEPSRRRARPTARRPPRRAPASSRTRPLRTSAATSSSTGTRAGPAAPRPAAAAARAPAPRARRPRRCRTGRPTAAAGPAGGPRRRARCRRRRPASGCRCPTSRSRRSGTRPGPPARRPRRRRPAPAPAARSTSTPSRASSCSRRPSTFLADTIGGTCSMSPVSPAAAARTSSRSTAAMSHVPVTSPEASSVDVAVPSTTSPTYRLSSPDRNVSSRVARPTPSTSTPVASGSSVPEWPTLRVPSRPRALATTSCDVQPAGLSTTATPSGPSAAAARHHGGRRRRRRRCRAGSARPARPGGSPRRGGTTARACA